MSQDAAYAQLTRRLQEALWRMQWDALRPVQIDAILAIRNTEKDVIISSPTASGKTEAAFLPILSELNEARPSSIGAIYVGPLKALINDQFQRLERLCEYIDLPVHKWHGDVSAGRKRKVTKDPQGILLITPESLESSFVNRNSYLKSMFCDLRYVVIDEFHALVANERGRHLRSLLHRLETVIGRRCRLVGLSATLGDWRADYAHWMRPENSEAVTVIADTTTPKAKRVEVIAYEQGGGDDSEDEDEDEEDAPPPQVIPTMLEAFGRRKSLIFANSRLNVERFADWLNDASVEAGGSRDFLVHHGSLSKEIRESNEAAMKGARPCSIVCSATLEMGIDVGDVERVGQIGAPQSVSSLVQRWGRSGRRPGSISDLRFYVSTPIPDEKSDLIDQLQLELLQALALVELQEEGWVEPPELHGHDLSTLTQQVLSVIRQTGGLTAEQLHEVLIAQGAFASVSTDTFIELLRSLAAHELITQVATGELILGPKGEALTSHYDFYSAFVTNDEYRVVFGSHTIGFLPADPNTAVGEKFLLGGRCWETADVDVRRRQISVIPSHKKGVRRFPGDVGDIHPRIRQTMCSILYGELVSSYLNSFGKERLADARKTAREAFPAHLAFHSLADHKTLWFTWTGSRIHRTILVLANLANLSVEVDDKVAILFKNDRTTVASRIEKLARNPPLPLDVAKELAVNTRRKYDPFLTDQLLDRDRVMDSIDVPGAVETINQALGKG